MYHYVESNQIWIVIIIFRLIWYKTINIFCFISTFTQSYRIISIIIFENNLHTDWNVPYGARTNASHEVVLEIYSIIIYSIYIHCYLRKKPVFVKIIRTGVASYSCEITCISDIVHFDSWSATSHEVPLTSR